MDISTRVIFGRWKCEHTDGSHTLLREHERSERPPHYVICPDCDTHWLVYHDQVTGGPRALVVIYPVETH